jgi:hypothetical protein
MARIKSLLTHVELDVALKSHNCQGNPKHRITLGDARLKVRNERGWDHYCLACAKVIVQRDINSLRSVAVQLDGGGAAQSASAPEGP